MSIQKDYDHGYLLLVLSLHEVLVDAVGLCQYDFMVVSMLAVSVLRIVDWILVWSFIIGLLVLVPFTCELTN